MKLGDMMKPRTTYISPSNYHIAISGARYAYQVAGSRSIIHELLKEAEQLGEEERARLGRELTESEAIVLARMFEAQFKMALAVIAQS